MAMRGSEAITIVNLGVWQHVKPQSVTVYIYSGAASERAKRKRQRARKNHRHSARMYVVISRED
jgi:hypothetical protein